MNIYDLNTLKFFDIETFIEQKLPEYIKLYKENNVLYMFCTKDKIITIKYLIEVLK
jgi:hypothetical protein